MSILRGLASMPEERTTYATVARKHRFRGTDAAGRNRRSTGLDDGAMDGARCACGTDTAEKSGLNKVTKRGRQHEGNKETLTIVLRMRPPKGPKSATKAPFRAERSEIKSMIYDRLLGAQTVHQSDKSTPTGVLESQTTKKTTWVAHRRYPGPHSCLSARWEPVWEA